MRRIPELRRLLPLLACLAPCACGLFVLGWALLGVPWGGSVRIEGGPLRVYAALLLGLSLPALLVALRLVRRPAGGPQVELLASGLENGDYDLIRQLFPNSAEVVLRPISGGYSGAAVLLAQSWGAGAALQRPTVIKLGAAAKLQPERDNYERYVKESVGNTATLLGTAQRTNRIAMRWAYAGFADAQVQTLAEYGETGRPLAPLLRELFSSRSTLGLLLGAARRDPQRTLYREYSWTLRDWARIEQAVAELCANDPGLTNPLPIVARWYDAQSGTGERANRTFDAPVATVHGDLNSRNILVDRRGTLFVIDFAHTGPGHLLRDFARLEAELLLVLNQPSDEASAAARVQQAAALLPADGLAEPTLRDLLQTRPTSDDLLAAIVALRGQAHDLAGPWLNEPGEAYLLALLHASLDTLRYSQCGPFARRAALLTAQLLCRRLAESDTLAAR